MQGSIRAFICCLLLAASLPAGGIFADSFDSEQSFRTAMVAFKEKSFYSARLLLQEIILKDPKGEYGDDAQYYLAMTYYYESDYKTAQFEFKALQRDFPESPFVVRAAFWNGEAWFYRKQYREAIESHSAFVRKNRENILSASALYTIGYIYNEQKRYDEAIIEFTRALKNYPESTAAPALTLQLGIAHFNSGGYPAARRQFETLLVKFTAADNLAAARFWLGKSFYAEEKFAEALREFSAVLKDYPAAEEAAEALYLSALCQYKQKKVAEAVSTLEDLFGRYPKHAIYPFARYRHAQLKAEAGDDSAALPSLLEIINQHQTHETFAPALGLLAEIRKRQGKTDEAILTFEALGSEKSVSGKSRKELLRRHGDLLYQSNRYAEASAVYMKLADEFAADQEGATHYLLLARSLYREGKFDDALTRLTLLDKKFEDSEARAEALFLRAEISYSLGKFTEALQQYARFIKRHGDHARAFDADLGIGWVYFELKQYARAADTFRRLLKNYKKPAEQARAQLALGACQYNLRDLEGARATYQNIIKSYPALTEHTSEAYYQLAWLEFRKNNFESAEKTFRQYLERDKGDIPRAAEAMYFAALCRYQLGDYAAAETQFTELYADAAKPAWIRERSAQDLARTRQARKDFSSAAATYRQFIADFPESQGVDEALYHLTELAFKADSVGEAESATNALRSRNKTSPWMAESLREHIIYHRRKQNFRQAAAALKELESLQTKPNQKLELLLARAELLADEKKYAEAAALVQSVLNDEDAPEPLLLKAANQFFEIHELQGEFSAAAEAAAKLAKKFEGSDTLYAELTFFEGKYQLLAGGTQAGRETLSGLLKSRHLGQRARYLLAESYQKDGDAARALDFYRQITQKPDDALYLKARLNIGELLFLRQEFEPAAREFSRVAFSDSRDDVVYERALYRAAQSFRAIKKNAEFESFRTKLREAFPQSQYLKELE
jgi:TolA-binding protein